MRAESVRGEAMIDARGRRGRRVYALSAVLREAIERDGDAMLAIDLKPDLTQEALAARLHRRRAGQSTSTFLRKAAGLAPVAIAMLREAGPSPGEAEALAAAHQTLALRLIAPAPIARAISSAGGVGGARSTSASCSTKLPGVFVAGEMIDWEAPTGGYLLQPASRPAAPRGGRSGMDRARLRGLSAARRCEGRRLGERSGRSPPPRWTLSWGLVARWERRFRTPGGTRKVVMRPGSPPKSTLRDVAEYAAAWTTLASLRVCQSTGHRR